MAQPSTRPSTRPSPHPRTVSPTALRQGALGAVLLVAGVVAGVVSVYSNTRVGCATWVAVALVLTLASGLVLGARAGWGRRT